MRFKEENEKFIKAWGREAQSRMAIEEMSELIKELCKLERTYSFDKDKTADTIKHIQEEIADVMNMMEQLELLYGEEEVEMQRENKIKRTLNRLPENYK